MNGFEFSFGVFTLILIGYVGNKIEEAKKKRILFRAAYPTIPYHLQGQPARGGATHNFTVNQDEPQEEKAYEFQEHFYDWVDNSDFLTFNDDF